MGILSKIKDKIVDDIIPKELTSGEEFKKQLRNIIPNEVADIAVKAAPFVAPFQPGIAAAMRGIGRFDQRGSVSDALKQGLGTFALGSAANYGLGKIPTGGKTIQDVDILEKVVKSDKEPSKLKKILDKASKVTNIFKGNKEKEDEKEKKSRGILDVGMDILTDPKKTIPLAMLTTYIKEKFFPGETQPNPYNVAMGKRGDDVAAYLAQYGPYDPLRDPNKNPYTQAERDKFVADNIVEYRNLPNLAGGGRVGFDMGGGADDIFDQFEKRLLEQEGYDPGSPEKYGSDREMGIITLKDVLDVLSKTMGYQDGGRVEYAMGSDDKVKQAAGIEGLDININPKGIMELDMREEGGFIPPVGVKEKADDIPAMLSNNEFVFTADAVRAAGGGSVDKGAQRMYQMMKNLEAQA